LAKLIIKELCVPVRKPSMTAEGKTQRPQPTIMNSSNYWNFLFHTAKEHGLLFPLSFGVTTHETNEPTQ